MPYLCDNHNQHQVVDNILSVNQLWYLTPTAQCVHVQHTGPLLVVLGTALDPLILSHTQARW